MIFEPVWVSSVDHLQTFERAYRECSYIRMFAGAYKLPAAFPYIRGSLGFPWRVPIVMYSAGHLSVEDRLLKFEAKPWRLPFHRLHHLRSDLRFTLTERDITDVQPFEFVSPIIRYYSLRFTRIRTNQGGELADFLLCVGGAGPLMGKIRAQNAKLSAKLHEAFPA